MNTLRSALTVTFALLAGNLHAAPTPSPVKGAEASVHHALARDLLAEPSPNEKSRQAQRDLTALFKGADAIISALLGSGPGEKSSGEDPRKVRDDIAAFPKRAASLAPAEAAGAWLHLVDRIQQISPNELLRRQELIHSGSDRSPLLGVLPSPGAWPALDQQIAARPATSGLQEASEIGLRLLTHTLSPNPAARLRDVQALQKLQGGAEKDTQRYGFAQRSGKLARALVDSVENPDLLLQLLAPELTVGSDSELELPDLVTSLGAERAEKFLRQALVQTDRVIEISRSDETAALARKLALELVAQLKCPQWGLANSLDAVELYEALEKRFPEDGGSVREQYSLRSTRRTASAYYLCALIVRQRTADAVKFALSRASSDPSGYQFDGAISAAEEAGSAEALDNFFHELLAQHPEAPFWERYVQFAAKAGQTDRMLAHAHTVATGPQPLAGKAAALFRTSYYKALLAADHVDEAVAEMQALAQNEDFEDRDELGLKIIRLGQLLEKPAWVESGLALARPKDQSSSSFARKFSWVLHLLGRDGEAERVLSDALRRTQARETPDDSDMSFGDQSHEQRELLGDLAHLYAEAGRPNDILVLFAKAPWWGAADLAEIYARSITPETVADFPIHAPVDETIIGYLAAAALAAQGEKENARRIVDAVLDRRGDFDPAFELRVALGGDDLLPRLDELFARDQFEERPLIWKAVVLLQKKQLAEAEKVVRQAIAIDPSDGEQGPGRRMRAYAVLADILEARGDQTGAAENRAAVSAIRLSEKADRFYEAGLLTRAVAMYEEALGHFADAYCIQSRLALREAELGHNAEAEAHYRRAYELMPSSFGRVESHCFGCERAFAGKRAESIADKVFTQLAATTPDKPQVFYLLGYLRQEEGRYREALPHFEKAVALDPQYLNAWKSIEEVGQHLKIPAARRDQVIQNIVRLDPLARHGWGDIFAEASDLRATWQAVATANEKEPALPAALLPLPASKAALAAETPAKRAARRNDPFDFSLGEHPTTPAEAIAQNRFIALAGELFGWDSLLWLR